MAGGNLYDHCAYVSIHFYNKYSYHRSLLFLKDIQMINVRQGYSLDDLLLIPKYSKIKSRKDIDLSVDLGKGIKLDIPIVSANMKHVTGPHLAGELAKLGGLGILHRFQNTEFNKLQDFLVAKDIAGKYSYRVGVSVGISEEDKKLCGQYVNAGAKIICVDIAYAFNKYCGEMVRWISKNYPDVLLIAGNICTQEGARFLVECGADVIKCNVGSGSICSTRVMTGCGSPSLTCMSDIYDYNITNTQNFDKEFKIIADGGIKNSGDCVKNLCFSHAVMLGSLLAGTLESPGEIKTINEKQYKEYSGSSTHKTSYIEGVKGYVEYKGPLKQIIEELLQGIRSGCSYQGSRSLEELRKDPEFIKITTAGLIESRPHSIILK